jgi:hypothetical protein
LITREKFDFIKGKYDKHASWAVWAKQGDTPKSNMGDLIVLDPEINKNLLSELDPNVILVGLNFSEDVNHKPFENFHAGGKFQDYKTRYALRDSPYWGGYMTDILKDYPEKDSKKVNTHLKKHPALEQQNITKFRQEITDIGATNPLLVAFGNIVYDILKRNLADFEIVKIPHYANYVAKEKYREQVKLVWTQY